MSRTIKTATEIKVGKRTADEGRNQEAKRSEAVLSAEDVPVIIVVSRRLFWSSVETQSWSPSGFQAFLGEEVEVDFGSRRSGSNGVKLKGSELQERRFARMRC